MFIFKRIAAIINIRLFPCTQETLIETYRLEKNYRNRYSRNRKQPLRARNDRSVNIQNI